MLRIGPRTWIGIGIGLTALAAAGALFVWPRISTDARAAREARGAFATGQYQAAGLALDRWLSAEPTSPEAHLLKGRVAVAMGRPSEAADLLKQAHALGGPRDELDLLQALIAAKIGQNAEAEPVLRRAFERQSSPDRQVDEALAKIYIETYDLTLSAAVLQVWTRDFPEDAKPYVWWAEVHSRVPDEVSKVENDYREALKRDSSLARAHLGLAEELPQGTQERRGQDRIRSLLGPRAQRGCAPGGRPQPGRIRRPRQRGPPLEARDGAGP